LQTKTRFKVQEIWSRTHVIMLTTATLLTISNTRQRSR